MTSLRCAPFAISAIILWTWTTPLTAEVLPGTKPLTGKEDLAKVMVEGIDKYLTRALEASVAGRAQFWKPDFSSPKAYATSVQPNRDRLKKILGVVDQRLQMQMDQVAPTDRPALVGETARYKVYTVRWPVLPGVDGEGLLLEPAGKATANVIALPDAAWTPEMAVGLVPGVDKQAQFARRLAENGCRVLVPTLVDRQDTWSGSTRINRFTNQPHREFVYRMAYQMGRHTIGYEVQKVLAAVDWFTRDQAKPPVGVIGYGEGGLLALYSAALDTRIQATVVSGAFGPRNQIDREPIYRNVWGLLKEFGDGDLLRLIVPRALIVEHAPYPTIVSPVPYKNRGGAAPGTSVEPSLQEVRAEIDRVMSRLPSRQDFPRATISLKARDRALASVETLQSFVKALGQAGSWQKEEEPVKARSSPVDPAVRQKRQFDQLVDYTQKLLPASAHRRQEFAWSKLDTSAPAKLAKSQEPLRDYFHDEIIGRLPAPTMPLNPRTRLLYETPKWKGYEVVLDLYEDVICYGILLVPKDLKPGEKRPVVICQHGLEGRPSDIVNPDKKTPYYNSFGAQLTDRGYVVFAPQNPYIFRNDFRQLVRKANPLQLTLYSFIVRQHERILDWLVTLPFVDGTRIAYYGLSYGGKVAMRIPVLVGRYVVVICAGDFNEWIWKNVNLEWPGSYMFTGEYEMFEFDLGNTFNYAEMAALMAPRPFMVERGHNDGVGLDEYVAFEFAKVRRFYARMSLADRSELEFFWGGHEIHGQGTFAFLQRHLHWPPK